MKKKGINHYICQCCESGHEGRWVAGYILAILALFCIMGVSKWGDDFFTPDSVKSDYLKQFVSLVFDKESEEVAQSEYDEIMYFVMHSDRDVVDYKRNDGELLTASLVGYPTISYEDIAFFSNIKVLGWDVYYSESKVIVGD